MKRLLLMVVLCAVSIGAQKQKSAFAGKWELDLKKSKDLPRSFKSVDQYVMEIQFSRDTMNQFIELKGSGQDVKFPSTTYTFDGKETLHRDSLRGISRWSKVKWLAKDKKFQVTSRVVQMIVTHEQQFTQTDVWQIQKDGGMQISMTQKFFPNDSVYSQTRYFHRLK